ncbi:MAG TPA: hypothetical protein VJ904_06195, partial [Tichowtungia sp.]|nr:hypothetical protein [Tichowtungia sp.]
NTDDNGLAIADGINNENGTTVGLPSTDASGAYNEDSWVGTTLKYTADIVFINDLIDLTFTFTDQDGVEDTLNAQVYAANYPGTYFGFATKLRNRGDPGSNRDDPPVLDYKSFSFVDNALQGYELWASIYGVGDATNDDDGDGLNNLTEYGLGGNPTNALDQGTPPFLSVSGSEILYVHPQRSDDDSLVYTVETTTNLMSGIWTDQGVVIAAGTNVTGETLDFVTNEVDMDDPEKFIRLKMEQ